MLLDHPLSKSVIFSAIDNLFVVPFDLNVSRFDLSTHMAPWPGMSTWWVCFFDVLAPDACRTFLDVLDTAWCGQDHVTIEDNSEDEGSEDSAMGGRG